MRDQLEPGVREPRRTGWPEGMEHSAANKSYTDKFSEFNYLVTTVLINI